MKYTQRQIHAAQRASEHIFNALMICNHAGLVVEDEIRDIAAQLDDILAHSKELKPIRTPAKEAISEIEID